MNKQTFLKTFYSQLENDVYNAVDEIMRIRSDLVIFSCDMPYFDIARDFMYRRSFSNFRFLAKFVWRCIESYPECDSLITFNPKLSPAFLSNLLVIITLFNNECIKTN